MAQGRAVQSPCLEGGPRWGRGRRAEAPAAGQCCRAVSSWHSPSPSHGPGPELFLGSTLQMRKLRLSGLELLPRALQPPVQNHCLPHQPSSPLRQKPAAFSSWGSQGAPHPHPCSCQD